MSDFNRRLPVLFAVACFSFAGKSLAECPHDANDEWPLVAEMVCQSQEPQLAPALPLLLDDGGSAIRSCASADSDPDGDGWGWEQGRSCRSASSNGAVCKRSDSDPDGDGWGWENYRSCRMEASGKAQSPAQPSTVISNQHAECESSRSDPDGDGWGFEQGKSCIVVSGKTSSAGNAHPDCSSSMSDPDGDGWGYENGRSCLVTGSSTASGNSGSGNNSMPDCSSSAADPDGDGWGYENGRSCLVVNAANESESTSATELSVSDTSVPDCSSSALDADSDGWGYENGATCRVVSGKAPAAGGVVFEQNFDDNPRGRYTPEQLNADWDNPLWHLGFQQERVEITAEPGRGNVMTVTYPANKFGSAGAAAFLSDLQLGVGLPQSYEQLYLSYDVKFSDGFEFVKGGKLPGLCGYDNNSKPVNGCNTGGGFPDGYDGWSARGMWREDGALEHYAYHAAQEYYYGDSLYWEKKAKPGQWHRIQHRVLLNTPNFANGVLEAWMDGQKVLSVKNMRYRKTANIGINLFYFSTFYGGNDPSWAPSSDQTVSFDNFVISTQSQVDELALNDAVESDTPDVGAALSTSEGGNGGGAFSLFGLIVLLAPAIRRQRKLARKFDRKFD